MFQSAPDITVGRNWRLSSQAHLMARFNPRPTSLSGETSGGNRKSNNASVSIRARHHCRAKRIRSNSSGVSFRFQSAPDITVGRNAVPLPKPSSADCFNPRPTSLSGETCKNGCSSTMFRVSIRARHHCRAKLLPDMYKPDALGFNPRPTSLSGETWMEECIRGWRKVSIRARHHCRAKHGDRVSLVSSDVFQSAPDITVGRNRNQRRSD